jgi:GntR family transcriptional repressor for pyruvate dehydrogenase complex
MKQERTSATDRLFREMFERIHSGKWAVGKAIPGERDLMEEFGVSRIVLRECLSRLRVLGILNISHGKPSTVAKVDTQVFAQLFSLMLSFEAKQTLEDISQVRLTIELDTAYLAAKRRTHQDITRLDELVMRLREQLGEPLARAAETDSAFHIQVARATHNSLFPVLLEVLSGFVTYAQIADPTDDPVPRHRAVDAHARIAEAIREQDPDRARAEMEAHVRYSLLFVTQGSGVLNSAAPRRAPLTPVESGQLVAAHVGTGEGLSLYPDLSTEVRQTL